MSQMTEDTLARSYARLSSLKENIAQMSRYEILDIYVQEYHAILDRLEEIGIGISEFRIPDSLVKPTINSSWADDDGVHNSFSEEKYVDKPYLLMKIDAILSYFKIMNSEKSKTIGYTKPNE